MRTKVKDGVSKASDFSQPSTQQLQLPPLSESLFHVLNLAYYMLLCPFKLRYDCVSDKVFAVRCAKPHKVIYLAVVITPGLLIAPMGLQKMLFSAKEESVPVREVLVRMTNLGWLVVNTVTKIEMWKAAETIGNLLSNLIKLERALELGKVQTFWLFKRPVLLAIMMHLSAMCGNLSETLAPALVTYPSEYEKNGTSYLGGLSENRTTKVTIFSKLPVLYENQLIHFTSKFTCLISFIFLGIALGFKEYSAIIKRREDEVEPVCMLLLKVSTCTKLCLGSTIFCFIFLLLPYYAESIQDVFSGSWFLALMYCHYAGTQAIALVIGAEAHAKLSSSVVPLVSSWNEKYDEIHGNFGCEQVARFRRRTLMIDAATYQRLGVCAKGMTMTYSLFGNIWMCILAYSISVVQLQWGDRPS